MSDEESYADPVATGDVMIAGTVGVVEASKDPKFPPGDQVTGMGGWTLETRETHAA